MPPQRSRPLEEYGRKRDFQRTPEPQPTAKTSASGRLFVVQKHRAQQLHYDFRLELDGVLLSWAVPKGPSLDPSEKRLAVQTEDHPIEYGDFEGIIPEEEYGGGTVMLWDRGEWSPLTDPHESIETGTLKFKIEGRKLRGAWTLVRIKEKGKPSRNWLLIKERDDEARKEEAFCVIDEEPFSAVSGRTIGEISAAKDRVWTSGSSPGALEETAVPWRRGLYPHAKIAAAELKGAKKAKMPEKFTAPNPTPTDAVPGGDDWLHEILHIGKRVLCFLEEDAVRLLSTSGHDWTAKLPELARAVARLPAPTAILDGVIANDTDSPWGQPEGNTSAWVYHLFDSPYADGYDLRGTPLIERKGLLQLLLQAVSPSLVYCDHVEGNGDAVAAHARQLRAPGIVSKQASSKYPVGEGKDWRVIRLKEAGGEGSRAPKRRRSRPAADEPDVAIAGIKLSHPGRILYPEQRVTKRMLAEYYEAVAPTMLRHVAKRPLSIYRCPGGIEKESFFQKQLGETSSEHLRSTKSGDDPYVALDDVRGLITLAQWNVLEIHGWGCREEDIEHPDLMIFDLDPGPNVPWEQIVEGAKGLRLLLSELGLQSFVKTSGGKGLHVAVPLSPRPLPSLGPAVPGPAERDPPSADQGGSKSGSKRARTKPSMPLFPDQSASDWDEVKDFAARVARKIVEVAPKHFTVFMSKPERRGKVFIDYHRNHRGSTCVVAYSTRARAGASVSTPLNWDELEGPQPRFHIFQVLERLEKAADPWYDVCEMDQRISRAAVDWLRG